MKLFAIPTVILFVFCLVNFSALETDHSTPDSYQNLRFWSEETNNCHFRQLTSNSCIPASVQMALCYLDYYPNPNQSQLATEMQTDIDHTTQWQFTYIPFENRGFHNFLNRSLSDDFDIALSHLKTAVSKNYPVIINCWASEKDKLDGNMTHARVVTGYNSTGIFCHDPNDHPNQFLSNSQLSELWRTDLGYWALIIEQEPFFNLEVFVTDWFGNPIPRVRLSLTGKITQELVSDNNGTGVFQSLTLGTYTLVCESQLQIEKRDITVEKGVDLELKLLTDQSIILVAVIVAAILLAMLAKHLRNEKKEWIPRIPVTAQVKTRRPLKIRLDASFQKTRT